MELMVGVVVGFVLGYGVRSVISRRFTTMLNPTEILAFAPWQDVPLVHMRTFRAAVIMSGNYLCPLWAKSGQTRLDDMRWFIDPNRRFGINLVWLNFLNLFAYPV